MVFSGFDDPVLRADAEQIGATYLVKPVGSGDLIELLRQRSPSCSPEPALRAVSGRGDRQRGCGVSARRPWPRG